MRYSLCFLLSTLALTATTQKPAYAAESPFKKQTAFWLRGSSISVLPEENITLYFSIVDKEGKANTAFSGTIKTNVTGQVKLSHIQNGLYEARLPLFSLDKETQIQLTLKGGKDCPNHGKIHGIQKQVETFQ